MLKILVIDTNFAPSVNRVSTLIKIKYWQVKGAKISILCSSQAKEFYKKNLREVQFFAYRFKWQSKSSWTIPREYLRSNFKAFPLLFKVKSKYNIVYSLSSALDFIFLPFVLKFLDRKMKWFVMADNVVPKPNERPGNLILKTIPYLAFLISNLILKKADGVFVVTNLMKNYLCKKGIKVIKTSDGYGLDLEIFKGQVNPETQKFNALFGARLHPAKGIFDLVEIMAEVVKKNKNFTLGIMGDGEINLKKKLYAKISKNRLNHNITFLGYKNGKERGDLYRNCDFFLFPSYAEGCPQVVQEAFAANKPVLAYNLPEYRDVFKPYIKNGQLILFSKGKQQAMANYILDGEYKKLRFYNKLEDYSWNKICQKELESFLKT